MQGFLCQVQHPVEYLFSKNLNTSLPSWVSLARLCQSRLEICSGFTKYGHVIWAWNQYKDSLISLMVSLISLMLDNICYSANGRGRVLHSLSSKSDTTYTIIVPASNACPSEVLANSLSTVYTSPTCQFLSYTTTQMIHSNKAHFG